MIITQLRFGGTRTRFSNIEKHLNDTQTRFGGTGLRFGGTRIRFGGTEIYNNIPRPQYNNPPPRHRIPSRSIISSNNIQNTTQKNTQKQIKKNIQMIQETQFDDTHKISQQKLQERYYKLCNKKIEMYNYIMKKKENNKYLDAQIDICMNNIKASQILIDHLRETTNIISNKTL